MTHIAELGTTVNPSEPNWLLVVLVVAVIITCIYIIYRCVHVKQKG